MTDAKLMEKVAKHLYYAEITGGGHLRAVLRAGHAVSWREADLGRRKGFRDLARAAIKAMTSAPKGRKPRARKRKARG